VDMAKTTCVIARADVRRSSRWIAGVELSAHSVLRAGLDGIPGHFLKV
jgi:hypothetical protein